MLKLLELREEEVTLPKRVESIAELINLEIEKDIIEVEQPLLREATAYLFRSGGKRLRPFLVLTCAEALGTDPREAVPPALAVEYLHNLSLIHDDMMDESDRRHGRATLHKKYGSNISLLVGDLLYAKAVEQASRVARHAIRMVDVIAKSAKRMCLGQFDDMSFEDRLELEIDDYLVKSARKTSALYSASCVCGMLAGNANEEQIQAMGLFGEKIGTAFQIWDDVLDLRADPLQLGKPLGLDIRDGKKTLVVIHFLNNASSAARDRFLTFLGKRDLNGELPEAVELLESTGSIEFASSIALSFLREAKDLLGVLPETPARRLLFQYADFLLTRNH